MTESDTTPRAARIRQLFVILLIVLPLLLTLVVKYAPALSSGPTVVSVSVVPPKIFGNADASRYAADLAPQLAAELRNRGVRVMRSPSSDEVKAAGDDLGALAHVVDADALILTAITVDAGIVQLNLQMIDPSARRMLYNNPLQSSEQRYPEMIRAAGAALERAVHP